MQLTVVVPTYNEADNLPKLVSALLALPIDNLKIFVVDDNSPDGTGELAEELGVKHPGRIDVLHRAGKLGLGSAYRMGFRQVLQTDAEAIAQMDADFSHPPELLVPLLDALKTSDAAFGSRYIPGGGVDERWPFSAQSLGYYRCDCICAGHFCKHARYQRSYMVATGLIHRSLCWKHNRVVSD